MSVPSLPTSRDGAEAAPVPRRRMPRAQRRDQLRAAARAEFVEHGYTRAAMDRIAERAGVSKPVVYQHFPGKHELFLDLLDEEVDGFIVRLITTLRAADHHREQVRGAVGAVFAAMDTPERSHRLIFDSGAEHDPAVRARVEAVESAVAAQITDILTETTHTGRADSELISHGVVAHVIGAARHWADRMDPATRPDRESAAATVDALLWSGLDAIPS